MKRQTNTVIGAAIGLAAAAGGQGGAHASDAAPGTQGAPNAAAVALVMERDGLTEREAVARLAAVDDVQAYIWQHFDRLRPTWGGAWLDGPAGRIVIAHTAGAPVGELQAALGDSVELLEVAFTTDQLDAAAATLVPMLGAESEGAPVEIAVDIQGNGIAISATDDSRPEVERLLAVASTAIPVPIRMSSASYTPAVPEGCTSRRTCDPPLRAGLSIGTCTSGLIMQRSSDGRQFVSTAGHCTDGTFAHNGRAIGASTWSMNSGAVDAQLVHIDDTKHWSPGNLVYRDAQVSTPVTSKAGVPSATLENTPLCVHGRSGDTCGVLVDYSVSGAGNTDQGRMSGDACAGDSGSAVTRPGGSNATAFGIHQGGAGTCRDANGYSIFTWTYHLEAALGGSYRVFLG